MELKELLAIQPKDYLHEGFFASDGSLREGINGYYSLAMAYRCREEGLGPDRLKSLLDELAQIVASYSPSDEPERPLRPEALSAFQRIRHEADGIQSPTLTVLFEAAGPWVQDWNGFAAFALHLQRIRAQLALSCRR
ncbi:MAG: hypothetical protein NZ742_06240 [Acidobacteria bacterium]|nr:hypothetical protein [Acidobacteriota bacterium]MDW7984473.1 hypothetical protein [Acidobacteriota bacterium]